MLRFRKREIRILVVIVTLMASLAPARADVRLSALFSDGVVLQRDQPVPVWGWAEPGEAVTVEFAGQARSTVADRQGNWRVILDPLAASTQVRTLVARGQNRIAVSRVLVGEVWLFSGQSNMAYLMSSMVRPSDRDSISPALARREIGAASDSLLREFRVDNRPAERPRQDVPTQTGWMDWTPENGPKWAAMAYFFGKRLRAELDVPIGIIMCAWGGSGCSSWLSAEKLRGPTLRTIWPEQVFGWRPNITPSRLYNGMLHSVIPFAVAGIGWYHGETEATPYHNPYLYRYLLAGLIEDWRQRWKRPDLPFYVIQLPPRENEPRWVVVRESQAEMLRLPHTTLVPTLDLGQSWDLHPRNKHDVAHRLADFVLSREYGKGTPLEPAVFAHVTREGSHLRVHFHAPARELSTSDGKPPAGFLLAGSDREFKPARARIDGGSVVVGAPEVPGPAAVRYAWAAAPQVNLVTSGGIPVPPFRSDDWPVDGQEMVATALPPRDRLGQGDQGGDLVTGRASHWHPCSELLALREAADEFFRGTATVGAILVRGFPHRAGLPASPILHWTARPHIDSSRGFTLEARVYVTRIGHSHQGLELEAGVRRGDGTFRLYRLSIFPLQVHTFQNSPAPRNSHAAEVRVLRSDLDYAPATYRIAVRSDGIAQIYRDGELLGTTSGEVLLGDSPPESYFRIGKTADAGEWAATIHHVAFDLSGAFSPAAAFDTNIPTSTRRS